MPSNSHIKTRISAMIQGFMSNQNKLVKYGKDMAGKCMELTAEVKTLRPAHFPKYPRMESASSRDKQHIVCQSQSSSLSSSTIALG